MCGIAGYIQRGSNPPALGRMRPHRPPRPGRRGSWIRARRVARGARAPAAGDHRRRGGAPSRWRTKTAPSPSLTTARSTTSPSCGADLEARGHRFRDPQRHGGHRPPVRTVRRRRRRELNGMFAFAIWDEQRPAAAGARPHGDQAALLRGAPDGGVAFASELGALLRTAVDGGRRRRRPGIVLIVRLRPPPATIVRGAASCRPDPPRVGGRRARAPTRILAVPPPTPPRKLTGPAAASGLLIENRRPQSTAQLVSDVPVGVFLQRRHRFVARGRAGGAATPPGA